jgi:nucleotidyltransferase substrate binding protein (TIGR01987 family)
VIQRFEYTWELAWKLMKDYLSYEGVVLDRLTPAAVIRAAFEAGLITPADIWMSALDARNKMAHVYDIKKFEDVIGKIHDQYMGLFEQLHIWMGAKILQDGGACLSFGRI